MWRDVDPRDMERERPDIGRGGSGTPQLEFTEASSADSRDTFTRGLDVPRSAARERIRVNEQEYRLSGDDVRTVARVGAFRVVPANELRHLESGAGRRTARELERLRERGLIKTMPYMVGRTRTQLVTLTDQGRELLETRRRPSEPDEARQTFYAGINRPRELAHDARIHAAYLRAEERLSERGARVRRVVLEVELKSEYQRFLQRRNRGHRDGDGTPERDREAIAQWAREHELPGHDGHVEFPDARIEYEDRDGRHCVEDLEIVTPHYRGAHAAAKAQSGFTRYRAVGARVGGPGGSGRSGRSIDPRLAEELLP